MTEVTADTTDSSIPLGILDLNSINVLRTNIRNMLNGYQIAEYKQQLFTLHYDSADNSQAFFITIEDKYVPEIIRKLHNFIPDLVIRKRIAEVSDDYYDVMFQNTPNSVINQGLDYFTTNTKPFNILYNKKRFLYDADFKATVNTDPMLMPFRCNIGNHYEHLNTIMSYFGFNITQQKKITDDVKNERLVVIKFTNYDGTAIYDGMSHMARQKYNEGKPAIQHRVNQFPLHDSMKILMHKVP